MSRFANRSKFSPFYALLQLPGVTISEVHINDPEVRIMAKIKAKSGICPQCGKMSKSVHSLYHRTLQDLAMGSNRVNCLTNISMATPVAESAHLTKPAGPVSWLN